MNIDINNIKSITVLKSNSLFSRPNPNFASPLSPTSSPIAIPDEMEAMKQEGMKRRALHQSYPNLKSMGIRDR